MFHIRQGPPWPNSLMPRQEIADRYVLMFIMIFGRNYWIHFRVLPRNDVTLYFQPFEISIKLM